MRPPRVPPVVYVILVALPALCALCEDGRGIGRMRLEFLPDPDPVPLTHEEDARLQRAVGELDAEDFSTREDAEDRLSKMGARVLGRLGELYEQICRDELFGLEVQSRLKRVYSKIQGEEGKDSQEKRLKSVLDEAVYNSPKFHRPCSPKFLKRLECEAEEISLPAGSYEDQVRALEEGLRIPVVLYPGAPLYQRKYEASQTRRMTVASVLTEFCRSEGLVWAAYGNAIIITSWQHKAALEQKPEQKP